MKFVPVKITQSIGRTKLNIQKDSHNYLFAAGIFGVLTGTVLACRATLKLEPKLEQFKEDIDSAKNLEVFDPDGNKLNEKGKDLAYVYAVNTGELLKLYAPALLVTAAGISCLTKSHNVLTQRNASLTAAYAAVSEAFEAYRSRVINELGEEKERDLYYGRKHFEVEGEDHSEEYIVDQAKSSPYSRWFDEGSTSFTKTAEMNRMFIQCQQNYANHLMVSRGHIFLNEVYDMLGLERSAAGAVVGWVWQSDRGDSYIDFDIYNAHNVVSLNMNEPRFILDFNVDGVIYDQIGDKSGF